MSAKSSYLSVWRWYGGHGQQPCVYRYPWKLIHKYAAEIPAPESCGMMHWMYTRESVAVPWWRWPNWGLLVAWVRRGINRLGAE